MKFGKWFTGSKTCPTCNCQHQWDVFGEIFGQCGFEALINRKKVTISADLRLELAFLFFEHQAGEHSPLEHRIHRLERIILSSMVPECGGDTQVNPGTGLDVSVKEGQSDG